MGLGFKCLTFKFAHMHCDLGWRFLCRFHKGCSAEGRFDDCADSRLDFRSFLKIEISLTADTKCWSLIEEWKKKIFTCVILFYFCSLFYFQVFFSFQTAKYVLKSSSGTKTRQQMLTFIKRWRRCRVSRRGYRRGPLLCPVLWKSWHPEPGGRYSSPAYGTRNG